MNVSAPAKSTGLNYHVGKKRWKETVKPYLFMLPCLVFVFLFTYYPFAKTFYLGFTLVDLNGNPIEFVWFENFINIFSDHRLLQTFFNTLKYTVITVPGTLIVSLVLALLAEKKRKGIGIYQMLFALPMAVSMSSAAMIFQLILNPSIGVFNAMTGLSINWFGDEKYAMVGIAIVSIWMGIGFSFLFLLAAVRNVPEELLEAAEMEGSSYVQSLLHVKLPLMSPTLFFLIITDLIHSLMVFGPVMVLTKGGPMGSSETMIYRMYIEAFENARYGYGSAVAIVIFIIVMIFTLITFVYEKKGVHYS
ncbi:sn-glycerol-3-phosphate transport system permease protein UgpA [Paenibacillus konkukensis]|uniref:Sn-glycerol-3-phosphate transport system permease protein UgpA n=1 Tax=Paenibacillus konkukensis TaxID=2020716 RepID=A0ABY4RRL3_9BACL|nr:sugar ABC transporter permease [Paenibacillus konkukensis]UQZ84650.1 sn-glycerol-3-phosphate transport system permease protein UgpA [Paenibacillus konkukensis]